MADIPVFDPEKAIGDSYIGLKRGELVALAAKICCAAFDERGENGYRGGIRPGNICEFEDGAIAIGPADKISLEERTKDSLECMAPEIFWNGNCSSAADVYSVGLMLYAGISSGRLPFIDKSIEEPSPDDRAAAVRERMSGKEIKVPWGAGRKLAKIIEKALAFKVEDRYADLMELADALTSYLTETHADDAKVAAIVAAAAEKEALHKAELEAAAAKAAAEAEEVPAEEETTVEEDSVVEEVPVVEEAPVVEETPVVEQAPVVEEAPVVEQIPVVEETPAVEKTDIVVDIPDKKKKPPKKKKEKKKKNIFPYLVTILALVLVAEIIVAVYTHNNKKPPVAENTPEPTKIVETTAEPTPVATESPKHYSYKIVSQDTSWDIAEQKCVEMGGHLVCINNAEELQEICNQLDEYNDQNGSTVRYAWIGCYRNNAGEMTWTNGDACDYYNWAEGEPSSVDSYDGAAENYLMLVLQPDGSWQYNDSRMDPLENYYKYYSGRMAYICEIVD